MSHKAIDTMSKWRDEMNKAKKFGEVLGIVVTTMRELLPPAMFDQVTAEQSELVSPNHAHWWDRTPDSTKMLATMHVQYDHEEVGIDFHVSVPSGESDNKLLMSEWLSFIGDPAIMTMMIRDFVRAMHTALTRST